MDSTDSQSWQTLHTDSNKLWSNRTVRFFVKPKNRNALLCSRCNSAVPRAEASLAFIRHSLLSAYTRLEMSAVVRGNGTRQLETARCQECRRRYNTVAEFAFTAHRVQQSARRDNSLAMNTSKRKLTTYLFGQCQCIWEGP